MHCYIDQAVPQKTRAVCTDGANANDRTEAFVRNERGDPWNHIHVKCRIHRFAGCQTKVFDLKGDVVSGIVNVTLSTNTGAHFNRFRTCFRQVCRKRIDIRFGKPPPEAELYRERALMLFCDAEKESIQRMVALKMFPGGHWGNRTHIEIYLDVPADSIINAEKIITFAVEGLVLCLLPRIFMLWVRHRWNGFDVAINDIGLMEVCHGLFVPTYIAFYETFGGPPVRFQYKHVPTFSGAAVVAIGDVDIELDNDDGAHVAATAAAEAAAETSGRHVNEGGGEG